MNRKQNIIRHLAAAASLILVVLLYGCFDFLSDSEDSEVTDFRVDGIKGDGSWLFMIYMAADNNLEEYALLDAREMSDGYHYDPNFTVLILIDRADNTVSGSSDDPGVFGENFSDTRLYRMTDSGMLRISGGDVFPEITATGEWEGNTGDAETLKKFIRFGKYTYPADKYGLVIWDHGTGPRGWSGGVPERGAASDNSVSGDMLYTAEITDVLSADESVDFLGFDACYMSSLEVAYQYRPGNGSFSADIIAAAATEEWGPGWDYEMVFSRINKDKYSYSSKRDSLTGGSEIIYDPYYMNPAELGILIAEEFQDISVSEGYQGHAFAVTKTSAVSGIKNTLDRIAVTLTDSKSSAESARNDCVRYFSSFYSDNLLNYPLFDPAVFASNMKQSGAADPSLCDELTALLDDAVIVSFAGSNTNLTGFMPGISGLSFFFPYGDAEYSYSGRTYWEYQWWYNGLRTTEVLGEGFEYGKLSWCADGAVQGNGSVENYFELLDYWYDGTGDSNGYAY